MKSWELCLLLLAFIQGSLGRKTSSPSDEVVQQPHHDDFGADVLVISATAEPEDFQVYVNGLRQQFVGESSTFNPGEANVMRVTSAPSHLVAFSANLVEDWTGNYRPMGFIASIEQQTPTPYYSSTDDTWRCRHGSPSMKRLKEKKSGLKWMHPKFDDSRWPQAKVLGNHGDEDWKEIMDVSSSAKWIWANTTDKQATVICRGWLSHSPDILHMTAESRFSSYVDGRRVGEGSDSRQTYHFHLPGRSSHLVAIHAEFNEAEKSASAVSRSRGRQASAESTPGIIASLQNPNAPSGVSSQLWKCVAQVPEGDEKTWWKTDYDDSAWQSAGEIEIHGGEEDQPTKGVRMGISQHATWVWARPKRGKPMVPSKEAYCRASMKSNYHAKPPASAASKTVETSGAAGTPLLAIKSLQPEEHYNTVPEISAKGLDMVKFYQEHVAKGRPFIIRGGVSHWPAIEKWTDEYLMEAIGKDDGYMTVAPKDNIFYFYGGKRDIRPCTVGEFLKKYQQPNRQQNYYLAQHALDTSRGQKSSVRKDVEQPPFSKILKLDDAFIWMGAGNQVTPAHFDNSENLMCMVAGTKKVRLYEPAQTNYLYPVSHTKNVAITTRLKNFSNIDLDEFPEFAMSRPVYATINAGDMLYMPTYWWHEVTSYNRNIAVNWWFTSHSFVLDSFYHHYIDRMPQTQWGVQEEALEAQDQTGAEDDGSRMEREEL